MPWSQCCWGGCTAAFPRDDGVLAKPTPLARGDVVLDLGRRYAVVAAGGGARLHASADPASPQVGTAPFAAVLATTGEVSGADGKIWRRVEDRAWSPREGLLIFGGVRDAVALSIELRVHSPPSFRANGPVVTATPPSGLPVPTPKPGVKPATTPTARPSATVTPVPRPSPSPTKPSASPSPRALQTALFGVVVGGEARRFALPGGEPLNRLPMQPGTAVVVVDETVGVDGQRYAKLEENVWVRGDNLATYAALPETVEAAWRATMGALAPGVEIDPRLAPVLWVMRREPEYFYLAETIREERVALRVGDVPNPVYVFDERSITFPEPLLQADARSLATALVREATHAWEHAQGLQPPTGAHCFEAELRAFRNQAGMWQKLNGPGGKEGAANDLDREHNEVLRLMREDPDGLKARLVNRYGDQCGYHGPLPTIAPATTGTPAPGKPGTPVPGKPGSPLPKATANPSQPATSSPTAAAKPTAPGKPPAKP